MANLNTSHPLQSYQPTAEEIDDLIRRVERHPLGMDLLQEGEIDAVAALLQVHAFTVERAREKVRAQRLVPVPV